MQRNIDDINVFNAEGYYNESGEYVPYKRDFVFIPLDSLPKLEFGKEFEALTINGWTKTREVRHYEFKPDTGLQVLFRRMGLWDFERSYDFLPQEGHIPF